MSKLIENINSKMENVEQKNKTQKDDMNTELDKISKELTTLQDELANLTKGRIEAPTVAFNAYLTTSGSYTENQIIKFPHVLLNEGNGYNETSGYFTATVSGLYQFFAHVCNQPSQYMTFSIVHGETEVGRCAAYEDSRFVCVSLCAMVKVKEGEQVWVKSTYAENRLFSNPYRWPSFLGVLLHV